jgi:hypothetical protein
MSMTSRVPKRIGSTATPALTAVILTAGVAIAAALAGCAATSHNDHTGDPVTYAGGPSTPLASLSANAVASSASASTIAVANAAPSDAAARVMRDLSGEPQLAGLTTKSTPSGLEVAVTLTRNDDGVPDVWLADLAVGAVAERSHSDQAVANDLVASATAVGPGKGGDAVTTHLGIGAVRLGQVFGSPSDSALISHVAKVAEDHGLSVADLQILHPLESALSVKFVVADGATIDWTIDELRTDLVGESPDVEGVLIELDDAHGQPLLQSGAAYRTGGGGLWFAPGQDARFGAVHGGTPGN